MKKKYSRVAVNNAVARIRKDSTKRLSQIDKPYKESKEKISSLLSIPEKKTFKSRKEVQKYKKDLSSAQQTERELESRRLKDKVRKGFIKAETKTQVALERGVAGLKKLSKQKVTSRKVLKKSQATLVLRERQTESVLNDPNRFFKSEMEETKRSMFL